MSKCDLRKKLGDLIQKLGKRISGEEVYTVKQMEAGRLKKVCLYDTM